MVATGGGSCTSSTDACGSTASVCCCASLGTTSSARGGGLVSLSVVAPPFPRHPHHLGQWGPRRECPATIQVISSATDYSLVILDYTSRGIHLLPGGLRQLHLLHSAFLRNILRLPRRHWQAGL
jgi:hypothetical protein